VKPFTLGIPAGAHIAFELPDLPAGHEGWFKAQVAIRVEGFTGQISASFEVDDFRRLRDSLTRLHESLGESARFEPRERQVTLNFEGDGLGHVTIAGLAYSEATFGNKLSFEVGIDQTFLPSLISELNRFLQLQVTSDV
jgi:hypothetical protein